jgi:hypothetical protein
MKKISLLLGAGIILASCNRDDSSTSQGPIEAREAGVVHYDLDQLDGQFAQLNESFGISAKASGSQLNYTYRGYAKPVDADGTPFNSDDLAASAIFAVDDVVFVTWHTNDNGAATSFGGSVAAYRVSGIGQYTFMDRVDFPEHDFYELSGHRNTTTGNIEVFVVGQRDQAASGYVLASHSGATVSRIDYDYINDEFWEPSFLELPLPGVAGTDIVAADANYYVLTGNGNGGNNGGLFEIDRAMTNVKRADQNNIDDGIALAVNPTNLSATYADLFVLDRSANTYRVQKAFDVGSAGPVVSSWSDNVGGATITPINLERGDLTWAQGPINNGGSETDSLIISAGVEGTYSAGVGVAGISNFTNHGACLSTAYDAGLGILYYAKAGDAGPTSVGEVNVIAMGGYAASAGPLVNQGDLVGEFNPPTSFGGLPSGVDFDIKEINVFQSRSISLASGDGGVYFLQRNK